MLSKHLYLLCITFNILNVEAQRKPFVTSTPSPTTTAVPAGNLANVRKPFSTLTKATTTAKPTTTSTTPTTSKPTTTSTTPTTSSPAVATSPSGSFPVLTPRNVPPKGATYDYGNTISSKFPNIYRDGGGGVTIGGYNIIMFSDTFTTNGGPSGTQTSFVANTMSYMSTTSDPRYLVDFGAGSPMTQVNLFPNETLNAPPGGRYAVWPSQSLVTYSLSGLTVAIGVMPVVKNSPGGVIDDAYSTMVQVVPTAAGPVATRIVQALFYPNEVQFGKFGMLNGPDGYTYLLASDKTGIKAARVPSNAGLGIGDRTKYQYYKAGAWGTAMPAINDAASNLFSFQLIPLAGVVVGIYSGEMFFSAYHNTYLIVFMDGFVDGLFRVAYSTTGQITGPWSAPSDLYQSAKVPKSSNQWNYAGHAYPGMDLSGNTLTLSYTYDFNYINIAKITFCNPASTGCVATTSGFLGGQ